MYINVNNCACSCWKIVKSISFRSLSSPPNSVAKTRVPSHLLYGFASLLANTGLSERRGRSWLQCEEGSPHYRTTQAQLEPAVCVKCDACLPETISNKLYETDKGVIGITVACRGILIIQKTVKIPLAFPHHLWLNCVWGF